MYCAYKLYIHIASSMCMVSEYMILMSQTIGSFCVNRKTPVWFKIQTSSPILQSEDLMLKEGETPFLRFTDDPWLLWLYCFVAIIYIVSFIEYYNRYYFMGYVYILDPSELWGIFGSQMTVRFQVDANILCISFLFIKKVLTALLAPRHMCNALPQSGDITTYIIIIDWKLRWYHYVQISLLSVDNKMYSLWTYNEFYFIIYSYEYLFM